MTRIDLAAMAAAAVTACRDWDLGYGQGQGVGGRTDIRDGGAADCSSLTAWAVNQGAPGAPVLDVATTWTGNLRARLTALGWQALPGTTEPVLGDVLLIEGVHVAVCVGPYGPGGSPLLAEAWINERGGTLGGRPGDQTGGETRLIAASAHPMRTRWQVLLRQPPAPTTTAPTTTTTTSPTGGHDMYLISTPLSDGTQATALVTETSGARTLDTQEQGAYITMLGDAKAYPWDWFWLLVRQAWERYNDLSARMGREADEAADSVVARLQAGLAPADGEAGA
ncbi:MAG: hypothetical protein KIA99_10845 [Actinomyces urogenitalis]|uniref:hypothetical protein n=1 Tax=Actinomyces urogenitalis TaxID=103621 RepID=UPI0024314E1B|nr:hypothetical protein [Actinomyces urogenitalis]MBS5978060.1 hypothetical protein [Actinomyces urogenitalis]